MGKAGATKPAHLAESVYDGVRAKIRRLQEEVRERDAAITVLHKVSLSLGQGQTGVRCLRMTRLSVPLTRAVQVSEVEMHGGAVVMPLQELDAAHARSSSLLADAEGRAADALAVARAEHEAALARHLSFMVPMVPYLRRLSITVDHETLEQLACLMFVTRPLCWTCARPAGPLVSRQG